MHHRRGGRRLHRQQAGLRTPRLLMTVCAIVGGYQGGTLSRRVGPKATQNFVLAVGIAMAAYTFSLYYAK